MGLIDTVLKFGGKQAIEKMATKFGLPAHVAGQAVALLIPALAGGLRRNVQSPEGLRSLLDTLTQGNHAQFLEHPAELESQDAIRQGNGILGHLLGGKNASRAVATTVSNILGVQESTIKNMLPMVASLAMGGVARQQRQANLTKENVSQSPYDALSQVTKMFGVENAADLVAKLFKQ